MIAAFLAVAILGGSAGAADLAGSTPAPSTPTVAMFGPEAGFAKARLGPIAQRHSITVGLAPEYWDVPQTVQDRIDWLDPVLDAWNMAAGWQLFIQVTDDAVADVTFDTKVETVCPAAAGACAWMSTIDPNVEVGYFEHCTVSTAPWFPTADVVAHELGHCLGFVDAGYPVEGGYAGIMTWDREWGMTPDNEYDRASLAAVGYREETS